QRHWSSQMSDATKSNTPKPGAARREKAAALRFKASELEVAAREVSSKCREHWKRACSEYFRSESGGLSTITFACRADAASFHIKMHRYAKGDPRYQKYSWRADAAWSEVSQAKR